jgi:hypothetical protein
VEKKQVRPKQPSAAGLWSAFLSPVQITYSSHKSRLGLNLSILNQSSDFPTYGHSSQVRAENGNILKKIASDLLPRFFTLKSKGSF